MIHTALLANGQHKPQVERVDPDLIDNALGDLSVANTFIDAADNFLDEVRRWVRKDGFQPNSALCKEVDNAQILLAEAGDKMVAADRQLRTALDHSLDIWRRQARDGDKAYRFNEAFIPYRDAWNRGVATYLLHVPRWPDPNPRSGIYHSFEEMMDPLYTAARDAAVDVLLTPAASAADMAVKQEIIDQQEMHLASDGELIGQIMAQLIADAIELVGGAA